VGERQMFPRQTKRIRVVMDFRGRGACGRQARILPVRTGAARIPVRMPNCSGRTA
jgi:hypothetical protein